MSILLIILGIVLSLAGFVGCVLPVVPGPPLGFLALILLSFARNWEPFSVTFLVIMGAMTVIVTVLDYIVPALGARKYGASKAGIWGSILGMLIGMVCFPPFGMFVGAFLGAVAGEMLEGKDNRSALRAGWGVFIGTMLAIVLKLAVSGVMLFYYVKAIL